MSVITKDGKTVVFNLNALSDAISDMFTQLYEDEVFSDVLQSVEQEDIIKSEETESRDKTTNKEKAKEQKAVILSIKQDHDVLRVIWDKRNNYSRRGRTSSVSDLMLISIPTPPTIYTTFGAVGCKFRLNGK